MLKSEQEGDSVKENSSVTCLPFLGTSSLDDKADSLSLWKLTDGNGN